MGHAQAGLVRDLVAVEEQVEVDRPRAPAGAVPDAAEGALDPQERPRAACAARASSRARRRRSGTGAGPRPDRVGLAELRHGDDLDPVLRREARPRGAGLSRGPRFAPSPTYARAIAQARMRTTTTAAVDGRVEDDVRLAHADADVLDGGEAGQDPSATAPASPSSSRRSGPANTSRTRLREAAVVDRCPRSGRSRSPSRRRRPRGRRGSAARGAAPPRGSRGARTRRALQLDGHADTMPRSTAAATASASTVSATSWTRSIQAPRSNAATAAPSDAASVPLVASGSPRTLPSVLFRESPTRTGSQCDEDVEPPHELEVLVGGLAEADPGSMQIDSRRTPSATAASARSSRNAATSETTSS